MECLRQSYTKSTSAKLRKSKHRDQGAGPRPHIGKWQPGEELGLPKPSQHSFRDATWSVVRYVNNRLELIVLIISVHSATGNALFMCQDTKKNLVSTQKFRTLNLEVSPRQGSGPRLGNHLTPLRLFSFGKEGGKHFLSRARQQIYLGNTAHMTSVLIT